MPFIPGTPESLLPRSDSKNPSTTCRGITGSGRPCRRPLKSPTSSPTSSPSRRTSRESSVEPCGPEGYCHQHKDQAPGPGTLPQKIQTATIKERTSVDTLVDRLGLLEVEQRKKERRKTQQPEKRPSASPYENSNTQDEYRPPQKQRPPPKPPSLLALLCCISEADNRPAPRPARPQEKKPRPTVATPTRPPILRDPSSQTGELLSLIPHSASPQTTAQLLHELAKPVSENDESGYIYMFWLTPETLPSAPPADAASSLLAPPTRQPPGQRRTSDVLNSFAATSTSTSSRDPYSTTQKTILLKIGRAANVQRRLQQWTRQCGYNLSLIRYYPYHPSPSTTSVNEVPRTPRKVPYAHKVERLIHIELNGQRQLGTGKCSACGREHREWFEVEASREGVKAVDEVVRRWVEWGERGAR